MNGVHATRIDNFEPLEQSGVLMEDAEILPKLCLPRLNYNPKLTAAAEWLQIVSLHPTPLADVAATGDGAVAQMLIARAKN